MLRRRLLLWGALLLWAGMACLGLPRESHAAATKLTCGNLVIVGEANWLLRNIAVFVADAAGVVTDSATITATLVQNGNTGTLTGTTTVVSQTEAFVGGLSGSVARFTNLRVSAVGTGYQLSFAASGLTGCTTNAFDVTPSFHIGATSGARNTGTCDGAAVGDNALCALVTTDFDRNLRPQEGVIDIGAYEFLAQTGSPVATALRFVQQPSSVVVNAVITPAVTVEILDQFGAHFSGTNAITLTFGANPGGATLGGTVIRNAIGGTATFDNLTVNMVRNDFTLVASAGGGITASTSLPFSVSPTSTDLSTQRVLWWKLDEVSGDALDSSGGGNTGTLINTPTRLTGTTNCRQGGCVEFAAASSQYITAPHASNMPTTPFTIAVWLRPADITNYQVIFSKDGQYYIEMGPVTPGHIAISYDFAGPPYYVDLESLAPVSINTWVHVVGTYDGSALRLYLNGQPDNSISITTPPQTGTAPVKLGVGFGNFYYSGRADELMLYQRALSAPEVASLFQQGQLVGWWQLDEGPGSLTAADSSGMGHTGTLTNGPTWVTGKIGPYALNFIAASNQYVALTAPMVSGGDAFTIAGWFKSTAMTTVKGTFWAEMDDSLSCGSFCAYVTLNQNTTDVEFGICPNGGCFGGSFISSAPGYNDDQWHHVVATQTAVNARALYIDGVSVGTNTTSIGARSPTKVRLGQLPTGGTSLQGQLDNMRLYTKGCDQACVTELYTESILLRFNQVAPLRLGGFFGR